MNILPVTEQEAVKKMSFVAVVLKNILNIAFFPKKLVSNFSEA